MSFSNKDTSFISSAAMADSNNTGINETDKYNLWENANTTKESADESNDTTGSKLLMGGGFVGMLVTSVLLGGKVFGEIDAATGKKVNPSEIKVALGVVIGACCLLIIVGFISQAKDNARRNQLADDVNKTAIQNQKSLQEQAKRMTARHKASTEADTKLYARKSELIGKSLTNMVAGQADDMLIDSKRKGIDLLKGLTTISNTENLGENIKNLESVNAIKAGIERNGFISGNTF